MGIVASFVAVFSLFVPLQVTVIGGGVSNFACGAVIDAFSAGPYCAEALSGYVLATVLGGVIAVAGFVVGGVILARTPA